MGHLTVGLLLSALASGALAIQAPSTPAQTSPAAPADGSTVTVTGCLRAGAERGAFVLERVRWTSAKPAAAPDAAAHHDASPERDRPTTPATVVAGQGDASAAAETLRLAGAAATLKLSDHVGHTVTVTGMLAARDPIVRPGVLLPDDPAPGDTTSRTDTRGKKEAPQRVLNVRSLTHVAAKCD